MSVVGKGLDVSLGIAVISAFSVTGRMHSRAGSLPQGYEFQLWERACSRSGAQHPFQDLAGGLRSRLNAIATRNTTQSNNTAHKPNFFQLVSIGAVVVPVDGFVATAPTSTMARPRVASFAGL